MRRKGKIAMMLHGRIFKDGPGWAAHCDALGAFTQGRTRKDAISMLAELVELKVGQEGFLAKVDDIGGEDVLITGSNPAQLFGGLLRYQRERRDMSIADAADRIGASSRSIYARMERGEHSPRLDTMQAAVAAIAPDLAIMVGDRKGPRKAEPSRVAEPRRARRR